MRIELPERAVWPLPPRPLVLPWPLDSPWPRRLRRCLAPGRGLRSCKRISLERRSVGALNGFQWRGLIGRLFGQRDLGRGREGLRWFGSLDFFHFQAAALIN